MCLADSPAAFGYPDACRDCARLACPPKLRNVYKHLFESQRSWAWKDGPVLVSPLTHEHLKEIQRERTIVKHLLRSLHLPPDTTRETVLLRISKLFPQTTK